MSDTTFALMVAAVLISSAALVVMAVAFLALYRAVRKAQADLAEVLPRVSEALENANATLVDTRREVVDISARTRALIAKAEIQLDHIDRARTEITGSLTAQAERVELMLDDLLSRVQDVTTTVHNAVMRPVREVRGVIAGIKAAVETFLLGRRPSVATATQDEEMFI